MYHLLFVFLLVIPSSTPTPRAVVTFVRSELMNNSAVPSNITVVKQYGRRLVVHFDKDIDDADTEWLASELGGDGVVQVVEPDLLVGFGDDEMVFSADQVFEAGVSSTPWNLDENEPYSLHVATLSTLTPNTTVASLDSGLAQAGVDRWGPVGGFDFISSPDYSNDQTGRDGIYTDPGDNGPTCTKPSWHGTRTVSVIKQVSPSCSLLILRVLGRCGSGFANDVTDAIVWSAGGTINGIAPNPFPAKVITMSLAGPGSCPSYLQSAVNQALSLGALLIAAAGNQGKDASGYFPGNCAGVLSIGASTRQGTIAAYSNFGRTIAFNAPGGDTANPIYTLSVLNGVLTPYYSTGTSFAAPHVAGFAALTYATGWRTRADFVRSEIDFVSGNNTMVGPLTTPMVNAEHTYYNEFYTYCDPGYYYSFTPSVKFECVPCPAGKYVPDFGAVESSVIGGTYSASSWHAACPQNEYAGVTSQATSRNGWCASSQYYWQNEWLQVDFSEPVLIIGSVIKGRYGISQWLTGYVIDYWNGDWYIQDGEFNLPGNSDSDTAVMRYFREPLKLSRYRIRPRGTYGWTSARWNLVARSTPKAYQCPPGSYSLAGASGCTACLPGSHASNYQSTTCSQCSPGQSSGAGAAECTDCSLGTMSNAGAGSCTPCSPGTAANNRRTGSCVQCGAGTFSASGANTCSLCLPGTISAAAGASTCSPCSPGTYASGSGLSSCASCREGTYNQATSAHFPMELSYINQCGSRWIYDQMCSTPYPAYKCADANRFLWKSGDWWWVTESGQCSPHNGWYGPSSGSDPMAALVAVSSNVKYCFSCPPGTWSAAVSANSAAACQSCAAGTRSTAIGAVSINTCQGCSAGSWSAAGSSVCTQCVAGSWSSTPSANSEAACQSCAAGTWSASVGANSINTCIACATGSYSTTPKATSSSVCIKCGLGYFSSTPKASSPAVCLECAPGSFNNDLLGRTSCLLCSIGTYSEFRKTGWDGNGCRTCQGGTYASAQGQNICIDRTIGRTCPLGTQYVEYDKTHDSFCDPCVVIPNCKPVSSKCLSDSSDVGLPVGTPLCMCAGGLEMVSKTCRPCQPGFFRPDLDPSNKCAAWTVQNCGSGKFPVNGTLTTDSSCMSCPSPPPNTVFSGNECAWECVLGFE